MNRFIKPQYDNYLNFIWESDFTLCLMTQYNNSPEGTQMIVNSFFGLS